jgi:Questin oxidase-like
MRYSATYANGMSNHLPMALHAIRRLGATSDRAGEFASFYARRLRPMSAAEAADADRLAAELARDGREAFLRKHVARLTPGIGSAAFHGVIRTAYAVDSGVDDDLADAIAAWERHYSVIESSAGDGRPAADLFAAVRGDDRFGGAFAGTSISGRIAKVVSMPAFRDYRFAAPALPDLVTIAVKIYLASGDFTALHLLTGCHAARVLAPYLASHALHHLATAMLAAYVTIGRPAFDVEVSDAPDWETLARQAIASNDDHDLKLVYSAREEEAVYGWGLHRMAAALRLDNLSGTT